MGARSRRKGARTERELVALLQGVFPGCHRNLDQMRESSGRDVLGTPGFVWQAKSGAAPRWRAALDEAIAEAGLDEVPIAATRGDRAGWVVHLALGDFLGLLKGGTR